MSQRGKVEITFTPPGSDRDYVIRQAFVRDYHHEEVDPDVVTTLLIDVTLPLMLELAQGYRGKRADGQT